MAPLTRMAFSKARRVMIWDMRMSWRTSSTMRRPAIWASTPRRESTAGMAALSVRPMPSASTMLAMVEAVPMVMQLPAERLCPCSAAMMSSTVSLPAFNSSKTRQTWVPEPMASPRKLPFSIGPPETAMVGRSQLAAPISSAGVVLSQPTSRITPSIGLPRIDSSTSMLARLRNSMAVGRRLDSPSDMTGNSRGKPPAS